MFLISKIVRGRRLLNELEKEEKEHGKEIQYHKSKFQLTKELQRSGNESVKHVRKSSMQGRPPRVQRKSSCVGRLPCRFQAVTKATDIEINQYNPQQQEQQSKFIGATSEQTSKVVSGRERSESNAIHHSEASTSKLNSLTPNDRLKRKAIRQKTDTSLPSEDDSLGTGKLDVHLPSTIRRTSSMPSLIANQQSTGPPLKHYNYNDRLNRLHKRALRFTWSRLLTRNGGKKVEHVFEEIFERMLRSYPIVRDIFNVQIALAAMSRAEITSCRGHARLIVRMYEEVIRNLDTENHRRTDTSGEFDPFRIGRAHAQFRPHGFSSNLWELLGETIIDVVLCQEAVRDLPGAGPAWVILTACLVDQLRAGFESTGRDSISQSRGLNCPFRYSIRGYPKAYTPVLAYHSSKDGSPHDTKSPTINGYLSK